MALAGHITSGLYSGGTLADNITLGLTSLLWSEAPSEGGTWTKQSPASAAWSPATPPSTTWTKQ